MEQIEPTQADRDAAALVECDRYYNTAEARSWNAELKRAITAGEKDDHPIVQAFARHADLERQRIADFVRAWNGGTPDGDTFLIADAIERGDHLSEAMTERCDHIADIGGG